MVPYIRNSLFYFISIETTILVILQNWLVCASVEVLRPRGVELSKKVFYVPDQDFSCIDGSSVIPFTFVNDDYCDCEDGSDEPGTSACGNAFFNCVNAGYVSLNIPSSRVNDNICDCCDGSDEYNSTADCTDTCLELGKQALEEQEKQRQLFEVGHGLWKQYSEQGKKIKEENKVKLENLKSSEVDEEKIRAQKEAEKNKAEEEEKAALDVYKAIKDEQTKKKEELEMVKHQEEEKKKATNAFIDLDINEDSMLTYDEIQMFPKFDTDGDGKVSEDEAKFFLHMKDSMELDEFVTTGWMIMKPIYEADKKSTTEAPVVPELEPGPEPEEDEEDETSLDETKSEHEETYDDMDHLERESTDDENVEAETEAPAPPEDEYDEETQRLITVANEARQQYKEVADRFQKIQDEIKQLQNDIDADFGLAEEFTVLKGQCFDYGDREYTYRFCPFNKASQIIQNSGSETTVNLGIWGSWAGPENHKYSKMKYENGQTCWNGPARSVMVLLQCGLENKLLSSSEPNRCEYLFEFSTPALCSSPEENVKHTHQHTEL